MNLKEISEKYKEKLAPIKIFLFDVDGILTTGQLYYQGEEVGFNRYFNALDGYGLKMIQEAGHKVGIITGGNSLGVRKRFEQLAVDHLYMGSEDKLPAFEEILEKEKLAPHQALYMGDEFFDLPVLRKVGFSATVEAASQEIRDSVDYICQKPAGQGCAREVIDLWREVVNFRPHWY